MTFVDNEKQAAALELCSAVSGLVINDCVPDYLKDYLMARVARLRRAHGIRDEVAGHLIEVPV